MPVRAVVAAFDLVPGPGLAPGSESYRWTVADPRVEFRADVSLAPGWHRLRLAVSSADRHAIRKRVELAWLSDGETIPVDAFEWNRALREDVLVKLARPADGLVLRFANAVGAFTIDRFDLRPASRTRTVSRALRAKVNLLRTYHCFWPVVKRGGGLLVHGRFGEFGRKVLRGIPDGRTMRVEVKRAEELAAMWWRRRAPTADEYAALRAEADAIASPRSVAVLVPADDLRVDHARQAVLSVLRQAYPHWELAIAWVGGKVPATLSETAAWDSRIRIVRRETWPVALAAATDAFESDRVLVLPPDWELTEAALLSLASTEGERSRPILVNRERLLDAGRTKIESPVGVVRAVEALLPSDATPAADSIAFPIDAGRTIEAKRRTRRGGELVLAANVCGIGGWDHVAFEVLKGLHSAGIRLRGNSRAKVCADLLPPDLLPEPIARRNEPQLVIAPPFLVHRYGIDANSAVYTMWEIDRIDPAQAAVLNRARAVFVPSRWGAECFRASGVTVPIEVVPLGYDPLVFHPTREAKRGPVVFGTAGALSAGGLRKNVGRVVDLFRRAFPEEQDVRLRVKITPNCPPFEIDPDPRIEVLRATLPYADLAAWNRSLDAYVNASFAEGFGLHLLEAMACGVPLVSPHSSGLTEFFDADVGYVVPHALVETRNEYYRGRWADPDDGAIVAAMRRVRDRRCEAAALGEAAAARARRLTWRDTGRQLLAALERHGLLESP